MRKNKFKKIYLTKRLRAAFLLFLGVRLAETRALKILVSKSLKKGKKSIKNQLQISSLRITEGHRCKVR